VGSHDSIGPDGDKAPLRESPNTAGLCGLRGLPSAKNNDVVPLASVLNLTLLPFQGDIRGAAQLKQAWRQLVPLRPESLDGQAAVEGSELFR
jgi:hypothetical protein